MRNSLIHIFLLLSTLAVLAEPPIEARVTESSQTLQLGEPVTITYDVSAEKGVEIFFPDSAELNLEPWEVYNTDVLAEGRQRYKYRLSLAPFAKGEQAVRVSVPYTLEGERRVFDLPEAVLQVVAPELRPDDKPGEIRPAKAPLEVEVPDEILLAAAGVFCFFLAGFALAARKLRRPKSISPFEQAIAALESLRESGSTLELGDIYDEISGILKTYLSIVTNQELHTKHTEEIGELLEDQGLVDFLHQADAVKFAGHKPEPEETQRHIDQIEEIIRRYQKAAETSDNHSPEKGEHS